MTEDDFRYLDFPSYAFEPFRLAVQQLYGEEGKALNQMGVPTTLTDELFKAHAQYRRRNARLELKANYSLIPILNGWFALAEQDENDYRYRRSTASSFIRRLDTLEKFLGVKRPRAEKLRAKLHSCALRHKRK